MHDWRPSVRVDLPIGVEGGAGDARRKQWLTTAGLLRLEELDVKFSLLLRRDSRQQPLALLVRPGDAHGRALEVTNRSAAQRFEKLGELGKDVPSRQTQPQQRRVVVGVVLPADEPCRHGRRLAADATAFEDGRREPDAPRGQRHGAAHDAAAHDGDVHIPQVVAHAVHQPRSINRPGPRDHVIFAEGRAFASGRPTKNCDWVPDNWR